MPVSYRVFWDTKIGNTTEECEDAFWPDKSLPVAGDGAFAVADGATESSYSRHWARLLVEAYGHGATEVAKLLRRLPQLQAAWSSEHQRPDLPWFAAEKLALGAFAALLGVRLTERPDGLWLHALAVGDCCLVLVRAEKVRLAWPVKWSADFGSNPVLLSSIAPAKSQRTMLHKRSKLLRPGDTVLLMTDAIAAWFLAQFESGGTPWHVLGDFAPADPDAFRTWARELRSGGAIRNDDVTVAILDVT